MLFVETPVFTRLVAAALSDSDYGALQQAIADAPEAGRLIKGGAGIRKLYLFAKNQRADLTRLQIKRLSEVARELK
jgi:hypothetical protein